MLAGLVLAGGQSQRMGKDKSYLTLPQNNQTMLEHTFNLLSETCESVLISGGQHKNGIDDIYPSSGPLSGIHAAIHFIKLNLPEIDELVVVPVDMPNLTVMEIEQILKSGRENKQLVCYDAHYFPLYLPINIAVTKYIESLFEKPKLQYLNTLKNKKLSIRNLFVQLQGIKVKPSQSNAFNNINTPLQWQQHCDFKRERSKNES